jgi:hypothetical protein
VKTTRRRAAGLVTAALLGAAAALTPASPALAHTAITIEPARAGAKNAVADVNAEAESDTAGVTKVQIFLPVGITPDDITPMSVPKGWQVTKQETGYSVAGPALAVGANAEHKIRIKQLPTYEAISFKVLQTYSDGRVDRWIGLPSDDDPEPQNPAPTVKLAGGSGTAPTATPTTAATPAASVGATSPAATPTASSAPAAAPVPPPAPSSGSSLWWIAGLAALAVIIAGVLLALRRRRATT